MSFSDINMDVVRVAIMVFLIVAFLGMWAWAWSSKRKEVFHEASMLPLEDDNGQVPLTNERAQEKHEQNKQVRIEE